MVSSKASIERLVRICQKKDITDVVISPGSRNAPLVISFGNNPHFNCYNIPDERVAAFFALGLSLRTGKPTVLCCTSGSALLNYAPAVAEAYYQKIPLLIFSADRPVEWIDQRAGQTLRQAEAFSNYIKRSFTLFEEAHHEDHLWYNDRIVNEAIDTSVMPAPGPVHINIPLKEPLYDQVEGKSDPKIVQTLVTSNSLSLDQWEHLQERWTRARRILIMCGQSYDSASLGPFLNRLLADKQAVILTECTSNVDCPGAVQCIDRTIESIDPDDCERYTPDLLITLCGAVVSKKIRFLFRQMNIQDHWHIDESDFYIDTYQALTLNVPVKPLLFFEKVMQSDNATRDASFLDAWNDRSRAGRAGHREFLLTTPWSDLVVFDHLLKELPEASDVFLANSTPIRYAQLFDPRPDIRYHSNRGVSGIDGCTSTAVGFAAGSDVIATIITGDIAFFYDSNAFWHHHLSPRLRIILINNAGGSIFRYIPGPSETAHLEKHFESHHVTSAEGLATAFGLPYYVANNSDQLKGHLADFFSDGHQQPPLLEINTPRLLNDEVLRDYFKNLKLHK